MNGKHHFEAGLCAGVCLTISAVSSHNYEIIPLVLGFGGVLLGSMFPDIDSTTSKLGQKFKITSHIVNNMFGHRGFFHCPLLIILLYCLCKHLFVKYDIIKYSPIYIWFLFGMATHLFCDIMTKGGIPLLYPFYKTKFSLTNMRSGSKREPIALIFVMIVMIALTIFFNTNNLYITQLCSLIQNLF